MIRCVLVHHVGVSRLGTFACRDFVRSEFIFRRRYSAKVPNIAISAVSEAGCMHLCELDFETSAVALQRGCYLKHSCETNALRSGVAVLA